MIMWSMIPKIGIHDVFIYSHVRFHIQVFKLNSFFVFVLSKLNNFKVYLPNGPNKTLVLRVRKVQIHSE